MAGKIELLIQQIKQLEEELRLELSQQSQTIGFKLKGKKVEFEESIRQTHQQLKTGIWRWIGVRPINLITAPIIYSMILPLACVDILISFYHYSCFPIYRIKLVKRSDYIVFDRHYLRYLNLFERFHCLYCSYANGVIGYSREILARTEQYFCPIKHARQVMGTHQRYYQFINYGDAESYQQRLQGYRQQLAREDAKHSDA